MTPLRIQRRRSKGWRMPTGVVYVGRGSRWGNPFEVGRDGTREECLKLFVGLAAGFLCISKNAEHVKAQQRARGALEHVALLKGKTLACWCRTDQACHGDVLIALANGQRLPAAWLPQLARPA